MIPETPVYENQFLPKGTTDFPKTNGNEPTLLTHHITLVQRHSNAFF